MLPKKFRLSREDFKQVMKDGRMVSGGLMGILILRKKEEGKGKKEFSKAGLIVSKKLSNKAVVRNKLKRRIRTALQHVLPDIHSGLYLVALPNRRSLVSTVEELTNEIHHLIIENCPAKRDPAPQEKL